MTFNLPLDLAQQMHNLFGCMLLPLRHNPLLLVQSLIGSCITSAGHSKVPAANVYTHYSVVREFPLIVSPGSSASLGLQ